VYSTYTNFQLSLALVFISCRHKLVSSLHSSCSRCADQVWSKEALYVCNRRTPYSACKVSLRFITSGTHRQLISLFLVCVTHFCYTIPGLTNLHSAFITDGIVTGRYPAISLLYFHFCPLFSSRSMTALISTFI
jgi:hypothetical protein